MALRFGFAGFQHGHIYSLHKKVVETDGFEFVAAGDDDADAREEAKGKGVDITHDSVEDLITNADCDVIAIGDYFAGPNHTLPTSGCAKFSSPLGVQDFVKTSSVISYSDERLQKQGEQIIRFAEEEQLFAHAEAIKVRLKKQQAAKIL